jgi:predicted enzyme related to lactoylglutathione lyase
VAATLPGKKKQGSLHPIPSQNSRGVSKGLSNSSLLFPVSNGLFQLQLYTIIKKREMKVKELRIILTVDNLDEVIKFYRDSAGLATSKEWNEETGNGIILEAGKASLEIIDKKHAARIDEIEVGQRVAGPVRLALNVGQDIEAASDILVEGGAGKMAAVRQAPWSKVVRLQDPSGMQLTLFENSTLFEK